MITYVGIIKSFNAQKGFGFIECPETAALYGKDIFVLKTAIPGGSIAVGTSVTFNVVDGEKNVEATNVTLSSAPGFPLRQKLEPGEAIYSGVIKSFNRGKGWGLISCDETFAIYGKDMFVLKTNLPGGNADVGEFVQFSVIQGEKGPEATNVNMGYRGVIKSFNPQKGWGLIACDETFQIYNKDMFVLRTNLPNGHAEAGMPVRFTVVQGEKGPEAANIHNIGVGRQPGQLTVPVMYAQPQANHKHAALMMNGQQQVNRRHTGTIKSFSAEKGWGFVTPTGQSLSVLQKDMFFLRTSLEVPEVLAGESVEFKVANGQKGLNAIEIRPMLSADSFSGMLFNGTVKSYNAVKGWGFITGDAVTKTFGRDVFFHKQDLGEQIPDVGTQAAFMVSSNNQGQPQATNINFSSSQAFNAVKPGKTRASPYGLL